MIIVIIISFMRKYGNNVYEISHGAVKYVYV